MPDPITAEQLAALKAEVDAEAPGPMRVKRLDMVCLLADNVDHIIAALREKEGRTAVVAAGATTEPVSNPYRFLWAWYGSDHVYVADGIVCGRIVRQGPQYSWQCGDKKGKCDSLASAKAAVEREVGDAQA